MINIKCKKGEQKFVLVELIGCIEPVLHGPFFTWENLLNCISLDELPRHHNDQLFALVFEADGTMTERCISTQEIEG
jgi:hypothetical protein